MRLTYLAHSLRSDWNNGNAHFLRGLLRAVTAQGQHVTILEPATSWSIDNLRTEPLGLASLTNFAETYPDLHLHTYTGLPTPEQLADPDIVILHEWNPPALAHHLLTLRDRLPFKLLFHDTHHRASSSPEQIALFGLPRFDGILAFGEALRSLYRTRFGLTRVWTLHEAADTTVFHPLPNTPKTTDAIWIGNWGEGERSAEISSFFLQPAAALAAEATFAIHGVRYPEEGLQALAAAHVDYRGYLPNLAAPHVYAKSHLTVHIPRCQYTAGTSAASATSSTSATEAMTGIPTIRVFEALASGIPLISAPWRDTEHLFRPGDFLWAHTPTEMTEAMRHLLTHPEAAAAQATQGLETILTRHTCTHRAQELTTICHDLLSP